MSLRTKLFLILSAIVIVTAVSESMIVYNSAGTKLEQEAERRLQEKSALLAHLVQRRFDAELRKFEHWAAMPLVVRTALDHNDPELISAFDSYFSTVVSREPYSSIYLINLPGDCMACDDPRRILHPYCRNVVSKRPGALAGFAGTANIGASKLSLATGRPLVPMTAPVWHEGAVVAILRTSMDMERLSSELLASFSTEKGNRTYLFDPSLPTALPKGHKLHTPTKRAPYVPPPAELVTAFNTTSDSVFLYRDQEGEYLVSSARMHHPSWVFLVSQPMSEILTPVRMLGRTTAIAVVMMLGFLAVAIFLITAPVIRAIEQCRRFAADVSKGWFDHRLQIQSSDEVGLLARDLNVMAVQLQLNLRSLKDAELQYRGIFENVVEGVIQTDIEGNILAANPALVTLVGARPADDLIGQNVEQFYADKQQRVELLSLLRAKGEVNNFPISLCRLDGSVRQVMLHSRMESNSERETNLIYGILEDVTERLEAKAQARQARETKELLLRTELEMLRYQINPHFLFNALNSLRELVITTPREAVHMIEALAVFCRASLVYRFDELSTVADELAHVESYLRIQQIRFGERLQVEIKADNHIRSIPLPAFILQPLVENAVKFGQKSGANPLRVRIYASLDGSSCVITIANTGRWFEPETNTDSGTQLGVENVRRRLANHYGGHAELTISDEEGWVAARVRFSAPDSLTDGNNTIPEPGRYSR